MKTEYSRKIGQFDVAISRERGVEIVGVLSNFGTIYEHNIERYKQVETGNPESLYIQRIKTECSLFGMHWQYGLTATVKAYINQSILKLYS